MEDLVVGLGGGGWLWSGDIIGELWHWQCMRC
jgi:hypothetical protein